MKQKQSKAVVMASSKDQEDGLLLQSAFTTTRAARARVQPCFVVIAEMGELLWSKETTSRVEASTTKISGKWSVLTKQRRKVVVL